MFRLTKKEYDLILRSQSVTLKLEHGRFSKYLPYVITEQGVAMLASVLKTSVSVKVSVLIMDAFVEMRKFIQSNGDIFNRISRLEYVYLEHEDKINKILDEMNKKEFKERIFYDGQIYDVYSLLINIIREAKEKIIIIDNYIDKQVFDVLSYKNENIKVEIWSKNAKSKLDYDKYNLQYPNVEIDGNEKISW